MTYSAAFQAEPILPAGPALSGSADTHVPPASRGSVNYFWLTAAIVCGTACTIISYRMTGQAVSSVLWGLTITTGMASTATEKQIGVSQAFGLATVGEVDADNVWRYSFNGDTELLAGSLNYTIVGGRLVTILYRKAIGKPLSQAALHKLARRSFVASCLAITAEQICFNHGIDPAALLPLAASGFGCLSDVARSMASRRQLHVLIGLCGAAFGTITGNPGLVVKNLLADILTGTAASIYYKDPLPSPKRLWRATAETAAGRRYHRFLRRHAAAARDSRLRLLTGPSLAIPAL